MRSPVRLARVVPLCVLSLACASSSGTAPTPTAPGLPAGADVNDPSAYYELGRQNLLRWPQRARDAFRWASELDPTWADPLYGERLALLASSSRDFLRYIDGQRISSPELKRADSLYARTLRLNPYYQNVGMSVKDLLNLQIRDELHRQNPAANIPIEAVNEALEEVLRRADPAMRGWVAASEGRIAEAIGLYTEAIQRGNPPSPEDLASRARLLVQTGEYRRALADMIRARQLLREEEDERVIPVYESKALYQHAIALAYEQLGEEDRAREAYAEALQEDLSYSPAHLELARLSLARGDLTGAVAEMELASELAPDDPAVSVRHGELLLQMDRPSEAVPHLQRTVERAPRFARGHLLLARAMEGAGRGAEAAHSYREFLRLAPRGAPERGEAARRAQDLTASGTSR